MSTGGAGRIIVVTGPPGAGKSTIAETLVADYERSALVAGDTFFAFLRRGSIEPWKPESGRQNDAVIEAAAAASGRLATGGLTVVYEGVLGPWYLDRFIAVAGMANIDYVVLLPPEDLCVARVRVREDHGLADEDATRQMHKQFVDAVGRPAPITEAATPARVLGAVREALRTRVTRYPPRGHRRPDGRRRGRAARRA